MAREPVILSGFFQSITQNPRQKELWAPMIKISLSILNDINDENIVASDLTALIDAGSDFPRIDISLAATYGLIQTGTSQSMSLGTEGDIKIYACQVIMPGLPIFQIGTCGASALRSGGSSFDFILGFLGTIEPLQEVKEYLAAYSRNSKYLPTVSDVIVKAASPTDNPRRVIIIFSPLIAIFWTLVRRHLCRTEACNSIKRTRMLELPSQAWTPGMCAVTLNKISPGFESP